MWPFTKGERHAYLYQPKIITCDNVYSSSSRHYT